MPQSAEDRLLDKLHELELQASTLEAVVNSELSALRRVLGEVREKLDSHNQMFFGTLDSKGINSRLMALEQNEEGRKWYMRVSAAAIIGLLIEVVYELISHG